MNFGEAIEAVKTGCTVARSGWTGKGMWVGLCYGWNGCGLVTGGENFSFSPFLYMKNAQAELVPWLASQADILADDWDVCGTNKHQASSSEPA